MSKCHICGRIFCYGDSQSPMLTDKKWNEVVQHYGLEQYERDANTLFAQNYRRNRYVYKENEHLFICYKCMEEALGRKLTMRDLMKAPINDAFIHAYIKNKY